MYNLGDYGNEKIDVMPSCAVCGLEITDPEFFELELGTKMRPRTYYVCADCMEAARIGYDEFNDREDARVGKYSMAVDY